MYKCPKCKRIINYNVTIRLIDKEKVMCICGNEFEKKGNEYKK